jgi:DNA polymerase IV (DinB-like DNA polymerase)
MQRIILHADLDSFYASAEELRSPAIKGKPVVICVYSGRDEDSGAVSTANYKARELGIKAGIPIKVAKRLAKGKDTVFLPTDMEYYMEVSGRVMEILEGFADRFQQASIDEAYIDVTEKTGGDFSKAERIARKIKEKVRTQEGITCSVGVGANKFVAKMASKKVKPDGLTVVRCGEEEQFLSGLPPGKLHGIGPKTAQALEGVGIKTAGDLARADPAELAAIMGGKRAVMFRDRARGMDESPVEHQEKKQLSKMGTLKEDTKDPEEMKAKLTELSGELGERMRKAGVFFRTVTIIAIDTRLGMHTLSETVRQTGDVRVALREAKKLADRFVEGNPKKKLRRVGIRVSGFSKNGDKVMQRTIGDFGK